MQRLNPITAGYLKLLELVSVILIALGGKLDPLFSPQQLSSDHPQDFRWSHDDLRFESSQQPSCLDSEPMEPNYYFDRYDPRSPFYDRCHNSDDWYGTFTGLDNHHGPDPFDSY